MHNGHGLAPQEAPIIPQHTQAQALEWLVSGAQRVSDCNISCSMCSSGARADLIKGELLQDVLHCN